MGFGRFNYISNAVVLTIFCFVPCSLLGAIVYLVLRSWSGAAIVAVLIAVMPSITLVLASSIEVAASVYRTRVGSAKRK